MENKQNKQNKNIYKVSPKKEIRYEKKIYKFNILFIGETGIGTKTSLIKKIMGEELIDNNETKKEICYNFIYEKDNNEILLYLIDTNGDNEKRNLYNAYYKNADCIIMGYDVTNNQSFEEIENYWFKKIKEESKTNLIYLLGNKIDLKVNEEIEEDKVKKFADLNHIKFLSVSVKDNINIPNFINDLKFNIEKNINNNINNGINEIFYGSPSKECYRTVLLGDSGVGSKTSFVNVVVKDGFDRNTPSTNGASYSNKTIQLKNGKEVIIDFWDTAGQEKYRSLTKFFIRDSDVIILGYDITNINSFDSIKTFWYDFSKQNSETDLIYLLGNKIDLNKYRKVSKDDAIKYTKENNIRYFEISCYKGFGIQEFIDDLTAELSKR